MTLKSMSIVVPSISSCIKLIGNDSPVNHGMGGLIVVDGSTIAFKAV